MSLPLFRTEALQARRRSWLGEVVLDQPPSARMLALGLTLACVGVVSVLTFGDYTRRTRVSGQLVPTQGLATVVAPVAGVVTELGAQEGDRLLSGQALLQVRVPGATRGVEDTRASVEQSVLARIESARAAHHAQQQRLQAQAAALAGQLRLAEGELRQLKAERETRRHQHRLSGEALQRFRQLHVDRYVTDLQLQQQENLVLETLGTLQSLQRQAAASEQKIAQLRQGLADVPIEQAAAKALAQREVAALEQERIELRARGESVVKAPIAGSIGALFVHNGQAVQAGQPLLALLPAHSQLEAHLTVPGAAIGFVSPGDAVLLRYAAYPYQKFGQHSGRVLRISRNALAAGEGGGEPGFRVIVALDRQSVRAIGVERPLRPGLIVEADILGERRRLWEWLVEPLQTLRGQLAVTAAVLGEMSAADASRCEQAAHPRSEYAGTLTATFRGCVTQRGLRADGNSENAHSIRADSDAAGLETDPGRNGVLAMPANRGHSTKDVSCVN